MVSSVAQDILACAIYTPYIKPPPPDVVVFGNLERHAAKTVDFYYVALLEQPPYQITVATKLFL